jgi:ribA/ribD-fused uncharacterized protein
METDTLFFSSTMNNPIVSPQHSFLCNFYLATFIEDGLEYKTVEHYFQSKKFDDLSVKMEILNADTPKKAKSLGRSHQMDLIRWESIKVDVMRNALKLKFSQNEELRRKLLNTGRKHLAEYSKSDLYWGGSQPGSQNVVGSLLMSLREELRASDLCAHE